MSKLSQQRAWQEYEREVREIMHRSWDKIESLAQAAAIDFDHVWVRWYTNHAGHFLPDIYYRTADKRPLANFRDDGVLKLLHKALRNLKRNGGLRNRFYELNQGVIISKPSFHELAELM